MEENAELQTKIAALAGRINRHKAGDTDRAAPFARPVSQTYGSPVSSYPPHQAEPYQDYGHHGYNSWAPQRGTPYGVPRGRGYASAAPVHRNRTLVVSGPGTSNVKPGAVITGTGTQATSETPVSGWVSKRDRHVQLINNSVYERKTQQRTQAMAETRQQKLRAKEEREKMKLQNHLQSISGYSQQPASTPVAHLIFVNDIKFIITDGGSKLIKTSGQFHAYLITR